MIWREVVGVMPSGKVRRVISVLQCADRILISASKLTARLTSLFPNDLGHPTMVTNVVADE